ncbi:MAG: HAMP domain-containing histidine kinase [Flavobacteriaceae bacterium]|nr:HAMP domain-containing histidine kinase [Flavobacteriaceae bacterium]
MRRFFNNRNNYRWLLIVISFIIISSILWNTYVFTQHIKEEERLKMEIWSIGFEDIANSSVDFEADIHPLSSYIIETNSTIPLILMNSRQQIDTYRNIDEKKAKKEGYLEKLITRFEKENKPIEINVKGELYGTVYYGNSDLITKLKYYPLALLLIIFLFVIIIFLFYKSSRISAQNKLWAGMAKETAHQIGTPLSSLVGWLELLKLENVEGSTLTEIEKDIVRLQTITDRFSKIGSVPNLERLNIVKETKDTFDYLSIRLSKLIQFKFESIDEDIHVQLNRQLYSWTIENLVKNAVDAMKGKGSLTIRISQLEETVKIDITDTGKGMTKKQYRKVFEPGFTTKKRGWGLGLSLAKRIIEDYHDGRIRVFKSEINKGTTMRISLKTEA